MPETPLEPNKLAPSAEGDEAAAAADEVSFEILYGHHVITCRVSCCALLLV